MLQKLILLIKLVKICQFPLKKWKIHQFYHKNASKFTRIYNIFFVTFFYPKISSFLLLVGCLTLSHSFIKHTHATHSFTNTSKNREQPLLFDRVKMEEEKIEMMTMGIFFTFMCVWVEMRAGIFFFSHKKMVKASFFMWFHTKLGLF